MSTDQIVSERKNDPRYQARIAIFNGPLQCELVTDYSINISTGGVFVETAKVLPEDTELLVKFSLPGADSVIVTRARVAWTNEQGRLKKEALPPGMGLQFLDLTLDDMYAIRSYLDKGRFTPTW